jgi:sn-glycerol 3-phosphate transport system substrate-binding protein
MSFYKRSAAKALGVLMATSVGLLPAAGASAATVAGSEHSGSPVDITFWSALSGKNGAALAHLIDEFNSSQSTYKVDLVYKGNYSTVLSATIAAVRAHSAPDIAMIFDAGTATMMDSTGVYVPVHQLMSEYHINFATSQFIGGAASYYETAQDQLDSMPFNSSTPVLYYNKPLLAKAGVKAPPKTWAQLASDVKPLVAAGAKCILSASGAYIMWTDIEQFDMWNGYPYATEDNGYDSVNNVKLELDTKPLVEHWQFLGSLGKQGLYRWDGTTTTTVPFFTDGTCAFYEQSSADLATIEAGAKFPFGVAELPYVAGDPDAPQNTVVGGASLWVLSGAAKDTYRGDAELLHFLMSTPAQDYWASHTGYVPVTNAAFNQLNRQGFYKSHASDLIAVLELTHKPPKPWTRGIRVGYLPEVRDVEATAIAAILSGKQSASSALATAQSQGDKIIAEFASEYGG